MKKSLLLLSLFVLAGCSTNVVTKETLQKNEWVTDTSNIYDDVDIELKFHENNVDINIDFEDVYQIAIKQDPSTDSPLVKTVLQQYIQDILKQTSPYTLEGEKLVITFKGPDNETFDLHFNVKKEAEKVVLNINPQNDDALKNITNLATEKGVAVEDIKLVLEPK